MYHDAENLPYASAVAQGKEQDQQRTVPSGLLFVAIGFANMPQAQFARRIDESPQTLVNWKSRGIPWEKIAKVARAIGLTVDQYLEDPEGKRAQKMRWEIAAKEPAHNAVGPRRDDRGVKVSRVVNYVTNTELTPATYSIPLLDVEGAMGLAGRVRPEYETILGELEVNQQFVRSHLAHATSPRNIRIITGHGDSMKGTYEDGSPLFVDVGVTDIKVDATYVFALNNELYIKRLQRLPTGSIRVKSDNPNYDAYDIAREELTIIGRVIAAWNLQRL